MTSAVLYQQCSQPTGSWSCCEFVIFRSKLPKRLTLVYWRDGRFNFSIATMKLLYRCAESDVKQVLR